MANQKLSIVCFFVHVHENAPAWRWELMREGEAASDSIETHYKHLECSLRTLRQYRDCARVADDNTAKMDDVLRRLGRCRDRLREASGKAPAFPNRMARDLSDFADVKSGCLKEFDDIQNTANFVLAQFPDWEDLE